MQDGMLEKEIYQILKKYKRKKRPGRSEPRMVKILHVSKFERLKITRKEWRKLF